MASSMTRMHFKALAKALDDSRPHVARNAEYIQWQEDCRNIAEVCLSFNENFDIIKFIHACKGEN